MYLQRRVHSKSSIYKKFHMIEKTKLYHLSYRFMGYTPTFTPRIPSERYEGEQVFHEYIGELMDEDETIPRICVSDSIENCLSAHPMNGIMLAELSVYVAKNPYMVTKDLPAIMVPDAKETGEIWILSETEMEYQGEITVMGHDVYQWKSKYAFPDKEKLKAIKKLEKDLKRESLLV